jgi:PiT family inorganic phosphate transporter
MNSQIILLIALALTFNFLNGFHDSSNIVATIIFSRSLHPRIALLLMAVAEFSGPFVLGIAVAKTIGQGIVNPEFITTPIIISALISGIFWNLITWIFGIPSSSSHAIIGGIIGAFGIGIGLKHLLLSGFIKILLALFISPIMGLLVGYLITKIVFFLARNASLRINWFFKNIQIFTGITLALSHGANDGQKAMGIIAMGLLSTGYLIEFEVPRWVIVVCAITISLGTAIGGQRLIKTIGKKYYAIRPVDGFCSQVSSAIIILGAALLGGPVSTTQVVSSAVMGVGSAHRVSKVRWGVAREISLAWLLTIPANALLASLIYLIVK